VQQGEWEKQLSRRLLVKKVLKSNVKEDDSFKNEINLLKFIRSEKDPRIAGYFMPAQQQKLYMEYYQHNLMVACQNWSEQQLLTTAKQIVEGVTFLATRKILHRDLKELNILMDTHNHPKIIDFGSSCGVYQ
jgi:serine/threonine protein kinase